MAEITIAHDVTAEHITVARSTEAFLKNCCVREAEVVGISGGNPVTLKFQGSVYPDIPVWIHTDIGCRPELLSGPSPEDPMYRFKDASLMFPFPGCTSLGSGFTIVEHNNEDNGSVSFKLTGMDATMSSGATILASSINTLDGGIAYINSESIVVNKELDVIKSVLINGVEIDSEDYIVVAGQVAIPILSVAVNDSCIIPSECCTIEPGKLVTCGSITKIAYVEINKDPVGWCVDNPTPPTQPPLAEIEYAGIGNDLSFAPTVQVLCSRKDTGELEPVGVIGIVKNLNKNWITATDLPKTYRHYVSVSFTVHLNIKGYFGCGFYGLYDLENDCWASIPTYNTSGVPITPPSTQLPFSSFDADTTTQGTRLSRFITGAIAVPLQSPISDIYYGDAGGGPGVINLVTIPTRSCPLGTGISLASCGKDGTIQPVTETYVEFQSKRMDYPSNSGVYDFKWTPLNITYNFPYRFNSIDMQITTLWQTGMNYSRGCKISKYGGEYSNSPPIIIDRSEGLTGSVTGSAGFNGMCSYETIRDQVRTTTVTRRVSISIEGEEYTFESEPRIKTEYGLNVDWKDYAIGTWDVINHIPQKTLMYNIKSAGSVELYIDTIKTKIGEYCQTPTYVCNNTTLHMNMNVVSKVYSDSVIQTPILQVLKTLFDSSKVRNTLNGVIPQGTTYLPSITINTVSLSLLLVPYDPRIPNA